MTQGVLSCTGQLPLLDSNNRLARRFSMRLSHVSKLEDGLHIWHREAAQCTLAHANFLLFDLNGMQADKLNVV